MTRTQRLRPVVQHTEQKQQQALRELAQSQGLLDAEQGRLEQLRDYRLDYLQKRKYDIGVFTPLQLQEFNRFMQQLDETIERQIELVDLRRSELEHKRRLWNLSRIDSEKLHRAVERIRQQESSEQERREQKALDEFASRKRPGV